MVAIFRAFKTSFLKWLILFGALLLIMIPFAILQTYHPQSIATLRYIIAQHTILFTLFRWSLIALFVVYWPHFVTHLSKKYHWEQAYRDFWQQQRWRFATWLILIDLVICEIPLILLIKV